MTTNDNLENTMSNKITINGIEYVPAADAPPTTKQIVIAHRGFVYLGDTSRDGDELVIRNAVNLRRWGTTKGLGELVNGPLRETVADPCGDIRIPFLGVIARMDVKGGW